MARRTKKDALETRSNLLDAAEYLFQAQGVSATSLQDIALRAGATRGAVYWHFKDKADLFNAMIDRVRQPLVSHFSQDGAELQNGNAPVVDALASMRCAIFNALTQIASDAQTRRVIEIAMQKVEYVEAHKAIYQRHLTTRNFFLVRVEQALTTAAQQSSLVLAMPSDVAAHGLQALVDGLIQNWLLDPTAFDLPEAGRSTTDIYFKGLGLIRQHDGIAV
ncbi:TetR family transcriptional regulator [Polaromonas sp.]|nr:TetR family transcriptional regulator [Polaromonas sp.]